MTWYARFVHLFLAAALSALVANVWLIHQVKAGATHQFALNMALAGVLALAVPLATTLSYAYWGKETAGRAVYVFHATCAVLAVILGLRTF